MIVQDIAYGYWEESEEQIKSLIKQRDIKQYISIEKLANDIEMEYNIYETLTRYLDSEWAGVLRDEGVKRMLKDKTQEQVFEIIRDDAFDLIHKMIFGEVRRCFHTRK